MLMIILALVALAALFYRLIYKPMNYWKDHGVSQGKPAWVFGHTFGTLTHTQPWTEMMESVYHQSPGSRYTGMYHLHFPLLMLKDPELLRQIGVKDFDHFTDHIAFMPPDSDPLFSKNLFSLQGQKWREMRTLLSPSFTSSKLRTMFGLMLEIAENFVHYFENKDEDVIVVEMKDTFSRFATDVIATTACGIKVNSLEEPKNEFYLMGQDATDFSNLWKNLKFALYRLMPFIKKVMKIQLFTEATANFFRGLIEETIKVREEKAVVRPDLINLLLEARKGLHKDITTEIAPAPESSKDQVKQKAPVVLTNEDITAQALVFFIAGFDSVSSVMCFTTYELAVNQDIQDRLRKEVRSTWEACAGKLTYETLLDMKYLDMVISESLRKWPNTIATDRVCTKPYTIEPVLPDEKPIHLKLNDPIWIPIYSVQRDPENFPNPERFDPERFSDENKANIKPYSFIPFGLGPRTCIGSRFALLETKMVMFFLLLHFEVVPVEKTSIPFKISKKTFTLNAADGFWLGLKKIKSK